MNDNAVKERPGQNGVANGREGAIFFIGISIGASIVWVAAHFAGPSFIAYRQVHVLEGRTTAVNFDGTAIGLSLVGAEGEGYVIAGAEWRQDDGPWNDSTPTCLVPLSSGQRVTLGVIDPPNDPRGPGRSIVVWLICHGAPAQTEG